MPMYISHDRGNYRKCSKCDMFIWEAHSSSNDEHICFWCSLDKEPFIEHEVSLKKFQDRLSLIKEK